MRHAWPPLCSLAIGMASAIALSVCAPQSPADIDFVDLYNNIANDNAAALIDGRRDAGCVEDEVRRTSVGLQLPNLLTKSACNSEVAVFAKSRKLLLITPDTVPAVLWTDAANDRLQVNLTQSWPMPVTIWWARGSSNAIAAADLSYANSLFDQNRVGVAFIALTSDYVDVSTSEYMTLPGFRPCTNATHNGALVNHSSYRKDRLNVVYGNLDDTGFHCPEPDADIVVIGLESKAETLAHEFGHALSLGHANVQETLTVGPWTLWKVDKSVDYDSNGKADFTKANLMWGGGKGRTKFSIGQAFRMNINQKSFLNESGVRLNNSNWPRRTCADDAHSDTCPWLDLNAP